MDGSELAARKRVAEEANEVSPQVLPDRPLHASGGVSYRPRAGGKKLSVRRDGIPALQALLRYRTWLPPEPPRG